MRQAGRYLPEYRAVRAAGRLLPRPLPRSRSWRPRSRSSRSGASISTPRSCSPTSWWCPTRSAGTSASSRARGRASIRSTPRRHRCPRHRTWPRRSAPVFETVAMVRAALPADKSLIGFCGAPWTVATYMVAGRGTPDQAPARARGARARTLRAPHRPAGRGLGRVARRAARGRRRRRPDLRQLGGRPQRARFRPLVDRPDRRDR